MLLQRKIRFVRADSEGRYPNMWREFRFDGCSLVDLRAQLAEILKENSQQIVVCVHSGSFARLTPLVTNLPRSTKPMYIVVLGSTSPGENFAVLSVVYICQMFIAY